MEVGFRGRLAFLVAFLTLLTGSLVAVGCGGTPAAPTEQLQVTCPASKTVESLTGDPVSVDFGAPSSVGGVAPVTITCAPARGSSLTPGTTPVLCTARDASQQTATCGLNVTVTVVGTLSATRFMAFGDSITAGSIAPCATGSSTLPTRAFLLHDIRAIAAAINSPTSYPSVLNGLLSTRYVTQSPVVVNEGAAGEEVVDDFGGTKEETLDRLRRKLQEHGPQVLLLQEGVNDLNSNSLHPDVEGPRVVKGLHDMIEIARQRGVQVFLGTLLPEQPNACRGYAPDSIAPANDLIRALAVSDGAALVDLYQAFGGVAGPYIGVDGLHPNELGYEKMAQTFLDAIRANLEH